MVREIYTEVVNFSGIEGLAGLESNVRADFFFLHTFAAEANGAEFE
jgi:hypothetical protein